MKETEPDPRPELMEVLSLPQWILLLLSRLAETNCGSNKNPGPQSLEDEDCLEQMPNVWLHKQTHKTKSKIIGGD